MKSKFKVGDRIICLRPSYLDDHLTRDNIYTIRELHPKFDSLQLDGVPSWWATRRFKLVDKKHFDDDLFEV